MKLLLWRNCIRRKRSCCASFCELMSPVFIVILFSLLYRAFTPKDNPTQQYLDRKTDVPSLAGFAYRMEVSDSVLALGE